MILSVKKVVAMIVVVSLLGVGATFGLRALSFREIVGSVEAEIREAETIYGPIRLTATLDENTFRLGEKINVTVTITNISNKTIMLMYTGPPKTDFAVYNSESQVIFTFSTSHGFIAIQVSIVLEPLESYTKTFEWNQQKEEGWSELQPVDSGTYYITGRIGPDLYYLGPKDENQHEFVKRIKVETPKIEIQIH